MRARKVHVVPVGYGWAVRVGGKADRTFYFNQEVAITAGAERAKRDQVELLVHGRGGHVRRTVP